MALAGQTDFEKELEIFRTEEEVAQQYFFAYLSVRNLAGKNEDVLRMMNEAPLFWITSHHAMLLSAFIALGRIFDQSSKHNIDRLLSIAERNITLFSKAALKARKRAVLSEQEAADYVTDSHRLTSADLRVLRKEVHHWRRVYEERYRDVRHQVFAHKQTADTEDANRLLAKASVDEMKALFAFLSALYSALWDQYHNGRRPTLNIRGWILPPDPHPKGKEMLPGERVYREGHEALTSVLRDQAKA